jgi:protein-S-isoprenylcysteine O-methyltransferase Ste14
MWVISWSLVAAGWFVWLYPFLFRAPHRQHRDSVTVTGPTRAGLVLEGLAILLAFVFPRRAGAAPELFRTSLSVTLIAACAAMSWKSVTHLGRQFRVHAGLYHDHQLVRTGPYAIVRHPIYTSLLGMLVATMLLLGTHWIGAALSLVFFVAGTEIRIRSEESLLESRFEEEFRAYRRAVPAYIPFVR